MAGAGVRMLRRGNLTEEEIRLIVATLKINNDLERMGDLAVSIGERVVSLAQLPQAEPPADLIAMIGAVRALFTKCLGSLIYRSVDLATAVLEGDDVGCVRNGAGADGDDGLWGPGMVLAPRRIGPRAA